MPKPEPLTPLQRLGQIVALITAVDDRCAVADGPVTPTCREITDAELRTIYRLASGVTSAMQRDPHHAGACEWKWRHDTLFHRCEGHVDWTEVKRVSVTPDRILMLARLLEHSREQPGAPGSFKAL